MSVSRMKKLTLVAMKPDTGRIMRKLMWLGAVELEKLKDNGDSTGYTTLYSSEKESAEKDVKVLESAVSIITKTGHIKRGLFSQSPSVSRSDFDRDKIGSEDYAQAVETARAIVDTKSEQDSLTEEKNTVIQTERSLMPWLDYDMRLSERETKYTAVMLGTLPSSLNDEKLSELAEESGITAVTETVSQEKTVRYVSIVYLKESEEETVKFFTRNGFVRMDFTPMTGTPAGEFTKQRERSEELSHDIEELEARLEGYGKDYDTLLVALDMAMTKSALAGEKQKLLCTERTVVLTGWIPCEHTKALEKQLEGESVYWQLDDPAEDDDVPVHLVNTKPAGYFESVVEMYSLPGYGKFDPTRIMMVFFFIIFGMMLADVVYGIMLSLGCWFICKKTNLSKGVKNMCAMFGVCGVSCTIWGVLFGSYLGDLPQQFMAMFGIDFKAWAAVDIMDNAIAFLVLSLAVGAIHMLTGMCIRFWILWKNGQPFSAIFDEGSWFVLFAGIGLYFLNSTVGLAVAGVGLAMLILTQGRHEKNPVMKVIKGVGSLYSLINYVSDLLSYSRIMALGLSSAVVASVFNILATMGGFTVPGMIMLVVILVVGHILNLAINLLGTFVHTSRLQYVEFFGKFYEDGGRPFRPVKPEISNTEVENI